MYPFCFLGARRGDGGCTLSAQAGGVGAQGLSRAQGPRAQGPRAQGPRAQGLSRAQLMHKFNNIFYL
jgi:hypothetical protein